MKNEYHEKQLTASILLIAQENPEKVLLIHHKKHGCWLQPGGHVEKFENPLEAAIREAQEETGIDVSPWLQTGPKIDTYAYQLPIPDYTAEYLIPPHGDEPEHYHVDWLYVVRLPNTQEIHREKRSSHDIGWFTLEEALDLPMFTNTQYFLKQMMQNSPSNLTSEAEKQ